LRSTFARRRHGGLRSSTTRQAALGWSRHSAAPSSAATALAAQPQPRVAARASALVSEVDFLRQQVEHLRTEVVALSGNGERFERPVLRRYRTGVYTHLPRPLRRQVKELRSIRHPLGV
jgi:hypothetical protein